MDGDIEIGRYYPTDSLSYFLKKKSNLIKFKFTYWNYVDAAIHRNEDFEYLQYRRLSRFLSLSVVLDLSIINRAKSPQSSFDL